jgi:hypothetical protein
LYGIYTLVPACPLPCAGAISDDSNVQFEQTIQLSSKNIWHISVITDTTPIFSKITFYKRYGNINHLVSELDVDDMFLSAFTLSETSKVLYTVWIGLSYRVRAYLFLDDTVHQVLEIGSKFPPSFVSLEDGSVAILLDVNRFPARADYTYNVYLVTEKGYRLIEGIKIGDLATIQKSKQRATEKPFPEK